MLGSFNVPGFIIRRSSARPLAFAEDVQEQIVAHLTTGAVEDEFAIHVARVDGPDGASMYRAQFFRKPIESVTP